MLFTTLEIIKDESLHHKLMKELHSNGLFELRENQLKLKQRYIYKNLGKMTILLVSDYKTCKTIKQTLNT